MRSLIPSYLDSLRIPNPLITDLIAAGSARATEELYRQRLPDTLEVLRAAALIQSTESSSRIEGITAPPRRLMDLIQREVEPLNRSEAEIAGYRDVLRMIHDAWRDIPFTPNVVLQFHRDLYRYTDVAAGVWKAADNSIEETLLDGSRRVRFQPLAAWQTPEAMEGLHERFGTLWERKELDPLILIPAYILDFLCIHPFRDGNGRMARLLSLLLLYKAGYSVGRWISLERIIEDHKDRYYETLRLSSIGWHEGRHDLLPWLCYFLQVVLLGSYRELQKRMDILATGRGGKTTLVLQALDRMRGEFTVTQLHDLCPTVSLDMVRHILREERDASRVFCEGFGRAARWRRVIGER